MNNIPEENKMEFENSQEEYSTVFSDPSLQKKTAENVRKKQRGYVVIISLFLVLLLAGGAFGVAKLIPERTDDDTTSSTSQISVLELNSEVLKTVKVTNNSGSYVFYSATETDSDGYESTNWYAEGYDKKVVSTEKINEIAEYASTVTAFMEITEKNAAACGLETPSATVELTMLDGGVISIYVGDASPDGIGVYIKLSTDDKIYLTESYNVSEFIFEEIDFADDSDFGAIEISEESYSSYLDSSGMLAQFDSLTVTGKNFQQPVVIVPNTNTTIAEYAPYTVSSPKQRIADNVDDLFAVFQAGVAVEKAYSFDVSAQTLQKFGLDNPDFTAIVKVKDKTFTYSFKLQDDGNYAVINEQSKVIKAVSESNLSFIDYKINDFYSKWVSMESFDTLSGFNIKTPDGEFDFVINQQGKDDDYTCEITSSGKSIKEDYFRKFYEEFVSLTCTDYTVEKLSQAAAYTVTMSFNDGRKAAVLTFTKVTESKYQYALNGVDMGRVSSSSLKKIAKYAERVSKNTSIK